MGEHIGTQRIETERLVLRRWRIDDAQAMFDNYANDPEVCRTVTWDPHGCVEMTRAILARWVSGYDCDTTYNWCIARKEDDQCVGGISFVQVSDANRRAEVGYCLSRALWGKGVMTEALKGVLQFAFTQTPFNRIEARHWVGNPASGRVMEKAGLRYEGTLRQHSLLRGEFHDMKMYAILSCDFE